MSALVFADVYFSIMLQVKFAANAIFKFCFFFDNKFGFKIEIIAYIFTGMKIMHKGVTFPPLLQCVN